MIKSYTLTTPTYPQQRAQHSQHCQRTPYQLSHRCFLRRYCNITVALHWYWFQSIVLNLSVDPCGKKPTTREVRRDVDTQDTLFKESHLSKTICFSISSFPPQKIKKKTQKGYGSVRKEATLFLDVIMETKEETLLSTASICILFGGDLYNSRSYNKELIWLKDQKRDITALVTVLTLRIGLA